MRKTLIAALAFGLVASITPTAGAAQISVVTRGLHGIAKPYNPGQPHRCVSEARLAIGKPGSPKVVHVRDAFAHPNVSITSLEAVTRSAATTWGNATNDCGYPAVVGPKFLVETSSAPFQVGDGLNTVSFVAACAGQFDIACTYLMLDEHSRVIEFDIAISPNADFSALGYSIGSVVTHELGHAVALGDVYGVAGSCADAAVFLTMSGCIWPGDTKKTRLGAGDYIGLKEVMQ